MSNVLARRIPLPKLSRFSWLMGLYAENHARLQRLFAGMETSHGFYSAACGTGLLIIGTKPGRASMRCSQARILA